MGNFARGQSSSVAVIGSTAVVLVTGALAAAAPHLRAALVHRLLRLGLAAPTAT
jgi:hypothetical protein